MKKPIRGKVLWCLEIRVPTAGPICDFRVAGLIQSLLVTIGSFWQIPPRDQGEHEFKMT